MRSAAAPSALRIAPTVWRRLFPRLGSPGVAPEQRGELVTRVALTGVDREIREECLGLEGHSGDGAGGKPYLETAEEREPWSRQDLTPVELSGSIAGSPRVARPHFHAFFRVESEFFPDRSC